MMYPLSFLFLFPALAAAALYPTSPINTTIFHPSTTHTNLIRWVDDSTPPSLNQLGNVRIDLLLENVSRSIGRVNDAGSYAPYALTLFKAIVATLAKSIPSTYCEVKLYVPPGIGPDSSDYSLVFVPSPPYKPIYSARFTISNATSDSLPIRVINPAVSSSSTFSAIISTETFGGQSSTSSVVKPTSTFTPGRDKIGTTASGGHRVRIESSARFKALYVLWPVLVGAALAS